MFKARKNTIIMIISIILMLLTAGVVAIPTEAVFDNDFNVTWGNDANGTLTVNSASDDMSGSFSKVIEKYKTVITFVSAIGAVTMVAVFIINFMKLGTTSGNPSERSKVIGALIWSGLAAAGLGSVSLIVGIFYGMLGE